MNKAIIALNTTGCIGNNGSLPWNCKEDLHHFREYTRDSVCITGRKTYEELANKFPTSQYLLSKDRQVVVCSSTLTMADIKYYNVSIMNMDEIISLMSIMDVIVIGGKTLFESELMNMVDEISVSTIDIDVPECDTVVDLNTLVHGYEVETFTKLSNQCELTIYSRKEHK